MKPQPWVKCILAPGSRATEDILAAAGLIEGLQDLGFYTCGFGCMSCIGNSGPVYPAMHDIADSIELASILSGNRNFDGRISSDVSQNYLCAPALVIAYSLVGTMDFDFETTPIATNAEGKEVFLRDIWPNDEEVARLLAQCCTKATFDESSASLFEGDEKWRSLGKEASDTFAWVPIPPMFVVRPISTAWEKNPVLQHRSKTPVRF